MLRQLRCAQPERLSKGYWQVRAHVCEQAWEHPEKGREMVLWRISFL